MKAILIALITIVATNASADLLRPGPRRPRPNPSQVNLKELADFRCYFNENGGRLTEEDILYYVDKRSGEFVDVKRQRSYRITDASITKTPAGRPTQVELSGAANVRLPGGGSVTIQVETDFLVRRRFNTIITKTTRNLYRPNEEKIALDCSL
ncbi:MAG TPA: hypothetical protein VFV50_03675 [Bdellovibrionales bacterium]|nr:hypothetical protein [Bdellovibrionales bacterium]